MPMYTTVAKQLSTIARLGRAAPPGCCASSANSASAGSAASALTGTTSCGASPVGQPCSPCVPSMGSATCADKGIGRARGACVAAAVRGGGCACALPTAAHHARLIPALGAAQVEPHALDDVARCAIRAASVGRGGRHIGAAWSSSTSAFVCSGPPAATAGTRSRISPNQRATGHVDASRDAR
eukprot:6431467-Prymnesium_polylepis.1